MEDLAESLDCPFESVDWVIEGWVTVPTMISSSRAMFPEVEGPEVPVIGVNSEYCLQVQSWDWPKTRTEPDQD